MRGPDWIEPTCKASWMKAAALASVLAAMSFWNLPSPGVERVYAQAECSDTDVCPLGVFCSGFEEGNKSIWDDFDGNPDSTNLLMTDPGPCNRAGNRVMRFRVPSGRGGADIVKVLPTTHDKLYARWYMKWEPGYDFNNLGHGGGLLHAGSRSLLGQSGVRPTGADWFVSSLETDSGHGATLNGRAKLYTYYRGMYQQCGSSCFGDSFPTPQERSNLPAMPPQFQTNQWYCMEMMLDGGTPVQSQSAADGVQTFWIDGRQFGPWTNLWHRTTANLKITIFSVHLFFHGDHTAAGAVADDIVVSTQRIGCHGSQAQTPSAPQNLRIVPGLLAMNIMDLAKILFTTPSEAMGLRY
jgi:hypothetical protein